ncbi:MAG: beta-lactamase family protein, partial [Deltaproteobacteria bacterium]|nr:beta-lactamase family protein [Deltaproteobacteria bacterium]
AVLLAALGSEIIFTGAAGLLSTSDPQAAVRIDSIFDLASLTKPFATTLGIMKLVDKGIISLDQPIAELLPSNVPDEKKEITVRLLLCHSSGLIDWRPYYIDLVKHPPEKRKDILREQILTGPLGYPCGKGTRYSDIGFMLLEWIIEFSSGMKMDEFLMDCFYKPLGLNRTFLVNQKAPFSPDEIAATENCPWRKKVIRGEVHDENAYALGGYSGHAGLFGCAEELFILLNMLRGHYYSFRDDFLRPETVQQFFSRQCADPAGTWALGWDTPSPQGSSAGRYFKEKSVGHLGYTGTSVWMDLEQDIMVILLSNRVHPTRENTGIKLYRPMIHDLIQESIFKEKVKIQSV